MNETTKTIADSSEVTLHFSMILEDGTEAVSTFGDEPTTLTIGGGTLAPGLEQMLIGLREGEKRAMTLDPDRAFGPRDEEKIHRMPAASFAPDMELNPGLVVAFETPAGDELAGIVMEIDGDEVIVDFNHPLSGRSVTFTVEIIKVVVGPDPS